MPYRSPFSLEALTICAAYWANARTRCNGCPLFSPCNTPIVGPLTRESLAAYAATVDAIALSAVQNELNDS